VTDLVPQWSRRIGVALLIVVVSGCAHHYTPAAVADPYGFFSGIWHGFVFPYALGANILSWCLSLVGIDFLSSIELVGRPNTGFLFYYVGYFLGISSYSAGAA
jgi:hypothetical protein